MVNEMRMNMTVDETYYYWGVLSSSTPSSSFFRVLPLFFFHSLFFSPSLFLWLLWDLRPVPSIICSYATSCACNTVWGQIYHGYRISRKSRREWELCKPDHWTYTCIHFKALEGGVLQVIISLSFDVFHPSHSLPFCVCHFSHFHRPTLLYLRHYSYNFTLLWDRKERGRLFNLGVPPDRVSYR